jgi:hypothetical protein
LRDERVTAGFSNHPVAIGRRIIVGVHCMTSQGLAHRVTVWRGWDAFLNIAEINNPFRASASAKESPKKKLASFFGQIRTVELRLDAQFVQLVARTISHLRFVIAQSCA